MSRWLASLFEYRLDHAVYRRFWGHVVRACADPLQAPGHEVRRGMSFSLNQGQMKIRLGLLEYDFRYT